MIMIVTTLDHNCAAQLICCPKLMRRSENTVASLCVSVGALIRTWLSIICILAKQF